MKNLLIFILCLFGLSAVAQLPTFRRNALTTNETPYGSIQRISASGLVKNYYEPNALANASAASAPGDILVAYGSLTISNAVVLTNVTLRGNGAVFTSWVSGSTGAAICPYAGTTLELFTIQSGWFSAGILTNTIQLVGTHAAAGQPPITNAVIRQITLYGDGDGFFVSHTNYCSWDMVLCNARGALDMVAVQAPGEYKYKLCSFQAGTNNNNRTVALAGVATNVFDVCTFILDTDAAPNAAAVFISTASSQYALFNSCKFINRSTNTLPSAVLTTSAATVEYQNCKWENYGTNTVQGVRQTSSASIVSRLFNPDLYSRTPVVNPLSAAKGTIFNWGGNTDPVLSASPAATWSGYSNLWLAVTGAAPSDLTADYYIDIRIGGTNLFKIPVFIP